MARSIGRQYLAVVFPLLIVAAATETALIVLLDKYSMETPGGV